MNLLLDTTIQIDRITGSKERKQSLENVLNGNELYCSTYVLGEYYNTIIKDFVTLFALFLYDRNIGETGKRITERAFGRSQSRMSKLYWNIVSIGDWDAEKVEDSFRLYAELLLDEFYINLKEVFDTTACARSKREIIFEDDVPMLPKVSCTKKEKICDVCSLWKKSEKEIDKIIKEKKVDGKIRDILLLARENEKEYLGNHCMTLGDIIICLEAFTNEIDLGVCSSNKSDFKVICDTIGLDLIAPDYSMKKSFEITQ